MGIVNWWLRNIFTTRYEESRIYVDMGYTHRLKVIDGTTTLIDDTTTGTNRSGNPYTISLWTVNPIGDPPATPIVRTVRIEVYDTNNTLRETHSLKYLYGVYKWIVGFVDENDKTLNITAVCVTRYDGDIFVRSGIGAVSIPDVGSNPLILELSGYQNNKKYYFVKFNPHLEWQGTAIQIKVYPRDKYIIKTTIDIPSLSGNPALETIGNFISWLGNRIMDINLGVATIIANALGLRAPVVKTEIDLVNGTLTLYYVNDPIPAIVIIAGVVVGIVAGVVMSIAIQCYRDIRLAEVNYEARKLIYEANKQYYDTVNEIIEFSATTQNPQETAFKLLSLLTPPQIPTKDVSDTVQKQDDMIEQLKSMLMLAIGGAIVIAVLLMVRK